MLLVIEGKSMLSVDSHETMQIHTMLSIILTMDTNSSGLVLKDVLQTWDWMAGTQSGDAWQDYWI